MCIRDRPKTAQTTQASPPNKAVKPQAKPATNNAAQNNTRPGAKNTTQNTAQPSTNKPAATIPATRPGATQNTPSNTKPSTSKYRGSVGIVDKAARGNTSQVINFGTVTTDNQTLTRSAESNFKKIAQIMKDNPTTCLLYTSPSPRDATLSRMPSSA